MWPLIIAGSAFLVSLIAAWLAIRASRYVVLNTAANVSVQKLAAIEAEMSDTRSMIESIRSSLHKMRSRDRMRDRNNSKEPGELPADREEAKRMLRDRIGLTGIPHRDVRKK